MARRPRNLARLLVQPFLRRSRGRRRMAPAYWQPAPAPSLSWGALVCLGILMGTVTQGCGSQVQHQGAHAEPESTVPADLTGADEQAQQTFARGSNAYAFAAWRETAGSDSNNRVFAPGSIAMAMAMVYGGARGETAQELASPFAFGPQSHAGAAGLLARYAESHSPLSVANRIYADATSPLSDDFLALTRGRYGAVPRSVRFAQEAETIRAEVNGWVATQTRDRIQDLLTPGSVDGSTRMLLINALAFNAKWRHPFEPATTHDVAFSPAPGESMQVPTMHQTEFFRVGEMEGARLLELPYENDGYAMVIALPTGRHGLTALEGTLTETAFSESVDAMQSTECEVALPRFTARIQPSLSLRQSLQAQGVRRAFTDAADFSGMTSRAALRLSDVLHQAFIQVDEEGTEAAAATAAVMMEAGMPMPPSCQFNVDQPFLYFVRDTRSGLILFMGRINRPE